jgi:hypothetical protein
MCTCSRYGHMHLARGWQVNPRFSLLSESLDEMKLRLFNFAIVMFLLLAFFTMQAIIMFGDKLPVFSEFGQCSCLPARAMSVNTFVHETGFPSHVHHETRVRGT